MLHLFLRHLPPLDLCNGPFHFLRAERPLDPLKISRYAPQGLVFLLGLLKPVGQPLSALQLPVILRLQAVETV